LNLISSETAALLRECVLAIKEFQSGIFALLGIGLGAWLSRRSELMRLRVERRTQIFDEACGVMARYSYRLSNAPLSLVSAMDERFLTSVIAVDRKIETHFSIDAYKVWRNAEKMIAAENPRNFSSAEFSEASRAAIDTLAKELK